MTKKILVALTTVGLITSLMSSCTSKKDANDPNDEITANAGDELEPTPASPDGSGDLISEELPENKLQDDSLNIGENIGETTAPSDQKTEPTAEIVPPTDSSQQANTEPIPPSIVDVPPPLTADSSFSNSTSDTSSAATTSSTHSGFEEPPKPKATLQKVANTPWRVGKTVFNTVYIAREGDTIAGISQMIYGTDKSKEIKKGNTYLKNREVKAGDKVYYNSPVRPTDEEKVITYYEDNGITPEIYVAKSGDNLKKISKKLLGYENAWKEVWSTNVVSSKGALEQGTELRYWKGSAIAKTADINSNNTDQNNLQMPPSQSPEPLVANNDFPPPPVELPPPPPTPMDMSPPPPPPSDLAMQPPPPPAVVPGSTKKNAPIEAKKEEDDMTMVLGAVVTAAIAMAGFMIVRKRKKQKEFEQSLDQTSVG